MRDELFSRYADIARKADHLFKTIQEKYPLSVRCTVRCCDCCYAVFGVFPIEAAYINYHFNRVDRKIRREVLRRAEKAEEEMLKAKNSLRVFDDKPNMKVYGLGKQRVQCPLLTNRKECILYERRPVICRIYGVPFSFKTDGGKEQSHVCGISGFEEKAAYPTVKLDKLYRELYDLSMELLVETRIANRTKAGLMLPLSRVLRMPLEAILKGDFEE
jgi:Fe-S-cluster containining protein